MILVFIRLTYCLGLGGVIALFSSNALDFEANDSPDFAPSVSLTGEAISADQEKALSSDSSQLENKMKLVGFVNGKNPSKAAKPNIVVIWGDDVGLE